MVKKIIRRLSKAASNEQIRKNMDAEDIMERILLRELKAEGEKFEVQMKEKEEEIENKQQEIEIERQEKEELKKAIRGFTKTVR